MGKDGSQWKHGYIPENAIATALKMHRKPGSGSKGSTANGKLQHRGIDLSTREAREKALKNVDITTSSGRALVAAAQRASLASTKISYAPGTNPAKARASLAAGAAKRKGRGKK